MPVARPTSLGEAAEQAAARKFGLVPNDVPTGYWDARHRSNGRKVQIKSASHSRADGPGVFRFWRCHLSDLREAGGSVVLVVVSREAPRRPVLKVEKVSPARVAEACRGRWRESRQADMAGKYEARVPWPELVTL